MSGKRALLPSLAVLILLSACGRVNPAPAVADVTRTVGDRSGRQPTWAANAEETAAAEARMRELLASPLTPESAVEIAFLNNRSVQASLEDVAVSQADLAQAGLLSNPEFGLSIRFPDRPPSAANQEYSLAQDLLDFVLLSPRKKLAVAELEQTKLLVAEDIVQLASEVKKAYYGLQADLQLGKRLSLIVEVDEAALQLARRQREAGNLSELDLANHEAALQRSKIDLALARVQARSDRERLNRLLGLWGPDTEWEISDQLPPLPESDPTPASLESLAVSQRLDVESARRGVDIVNRALSLKRKTRFLPLGVHVGVDTERETDRQIVTGPRLTLQLPIFDSGRVAVGRLEAQLRRSQRVLEWTAVNARSEVRETAALMASARELTLYYRDAVLPQRVRILQLTLQRYNMMLSGAYDLLAAKREEAAAEKAYVEAWRDYWIAHSELERALGGQLPPLKEALP